MGRTLLDKTWDPHVVADLEGGYQLLHIDRHLLHDLSGPPSLRSVAARGIRVRHPELSFATPDHCVSTEVGRTAESSASGRRLVPALSKRCSEAGIRLFDLDSPQQGIVHVIGPELGLTLPGLTVVCGDSHTCTHGALGALAWGIGSSELDHVLATQTLIERKPASLEVNVTGQLPRGVVAKDLILHVIAREGADLGVGRALEFSGDAIRRLPIEGRLTLCNLAIELGARIGQIAPDDLTFEYLAGRPFAPSGELWDRALAHWRTLPGDEDADFDFRVSIAADQVQPQITWGTSPAQGGGVADAVPEPGTGRDGADANADRQALDYMGLIPGQPLVGLPIDYVFIGSCTNSRLSDLQAAAEMVSGRKVAEGVVAWVVPGSQAVKREAEALGLDQTFREAGFQWREPGCSRCVASNGEYVPAGKRCLSTSNRNFVGRQGPGARTHLASPLTAAASAVAGRVVDVREWQ